MTGKRPLCIRLFVKRESTVCLIHAAERLVSQPAANPDQITIYIHCTFRTWLRQDHLARPKPAQCKPNTPQEGLQDYFRGIDTIVVGLSAYNFRPVRGSFNSRRQSTHHSEHGATNLKLVVLVLQTSPGCIAWRRQTKEHPLSNKELFLQGSLHNWSIDVAPFFRSLPTRARRKRKI